MTFTGTNVWDSGVFDLGLDGSCGVTDTWGQFLLECLSGNIIRFTWVLQVGPTGVGPPSLVALQNGFAIAAEDCDPPAEFEFGPSWGATGSITPYCPAGHSGITVTVTE